MCGAPRPAGEGGYNKSCHTVPHREQRQHSEKCVQQKLTPLKCCACPSSMEHFKCPSGSDSLIGTQSSWPPLFGYRKNVKKKCVLVFDWSLGFRPNLPKTQAAIGDHTRKWKIYFFVHFGGFLLFFLPFFFFACFSCFFTLIRVTGFFVVFPNKSYAWL